jgi:hypothetical protein
VPPAKVSRTAADFRALRKQHKGTAQTQRGLAADGLRPSRAKDGCLHTEGEPAASARPYITNVKR